MPVLQTRDHHPREVVVVTGASAGVGRATAVAFARAGADVALIARGEKGLEGARREVDAAGGRALVLPLDVGDAEAVERAASQVEETLGPIDTWVNNAMVTVFAPVHETTPAEYERVTRTTYLGTIHGTLAALARMRPRNRGVIVQTGSALSYRAIPLQSAYCGAKFAIRGFTDSLRVELLHDRSAVHLTMVQLSAFNTPQFDWARSKLPQRAQPVPPIFQPEVAADAIVWAARQRRREVWVGFPAVQAIVGNRIAPGFADRLLARQGYQGQLTDERKSAHAADNLFEPVDIDAGSHGRFDDRARGQSPQFWLSRHRNTWIAAGAVLGGLTAGLGAARLFKARAVLA